MRILWLIPLCLTLMSCKDNTPAVIKQALIQEQKHIIEMRMKRHEQILICEHSFKIGRWLRCEHCGKRPKDL